MLAVAQTRSITRVDGPWEAALPHHSFFSAPSYPRRVSSNAMLRNLTSSSAKCSARQTLFSSWEAYLFPMSLTLQYSDASLFHFSSPVITSRL